MLTKFQSWLTRREGWRACLPIFIAGAFMSFAFAPYDAWPVIFVSLPVFYRLLTASPTRKAFLWRAFFFGYGYSMAGTWWIANALLIDSDKFGWMVPLSVLGLSAIMALVFFLFGYAVYALRHRMSLVLFAALWVVSEYVRSIGMFGFPWNLAGYLTFASLPLAQSASVLGTYGVSFLVVLTGLYPAIWLGKNTARQKTAASIGLLAVILACYAYGYHRLQEKTAMTTTLLRLVQPSIPQTVKGTRDGLDISIKLLGELSEAAQGTTIPDALIWPETAYPYTIRADHPNAVPPVKLLLSGAVRAEGAPPQLKVWNSFVALDGNGRLIGSYDKHQLVPFGEFMPLRDELPLQKITPGDIDFSRGAGAQTITLPGVPPFSPLVCYEAIFPWMAADRAHRPDWLVNVTNDAWYGDSPGPYQHFAMVRMRAIEQGLPLVRAANNGISAIVDPFGRVRARLELNQRAFLDARLPAPLKPTLYARFGELISGGILALLFLCTLIRHSARKAE